MSDAPMGRSRRGLSKATPSVECVPLGFEKIGAEFQSTVLFLVILHVDAPRTPECIIVMQLCWSHVRCMSVSYYAV